MTARTIHTPSPRTRPLAMAAALLVGAEALLALVGLHWGPLAVVALVVAPGLALLPVLPAQARDAPSAALAAVPALGIAAASTALITAASLGVELGGVSVRIAVALVVAAGLLLPWPEPAVRFDRAELLAAAGGAAACAVAVAIQSRVVGEAPVPGNDWAKYVLYADEIARHGSLLIDNPFWMLGVPFREDPAVPSLYGAYLLMTGAPAAVLQQGIGLFALAQVAAVYSLGRALWGGLAGVVGAFLWTALPLGYTLLGWHGLANAAALALLPLLLVYLAAFAAGRLDTAAAIGAGLTMVGIAAAHRLSFGIAALTAALTAAVALALARERGPLLRGAGAAALTGLVLGAGVLYDLLERNKTFGGTQDHTAYLASKIDLELLVRDLTIPLAVAGVIALVAAPFVVRDDIRGLAPPAPRGNLAGRSSLVPVLALLAVVAALGYSWIVELPLHYTRMAYYLPLALIPLIAAVAGSVRPPVAAAAAALLLAAVTAGFAWSQADNVRRFYQFTDGAAERGLGHLSAALRPGEVVVTDRCWSFLGTWLLRTRTLPALDPVDIQPKAELPFARDARAVLAGGEEGKRVARENGVRFAIVDPTCVDAEGNEARPPDVGRPVFVSERLVVLRIDGVR